MKTDPCFGPGRERQHCGEACQELHINDRVDTDFSAPTHPSQRTKREFEKAVRRDRYHIFLWNDVHCVENEAIVFEHDEINVFTSDQVDRTTNGGISENGRALLRKLDE